MKRIQRIIVQCLVIACSISMLSFSVFATTNEHLVLFAQDNATISPFAQQISEHLKEIQESNSMDEESKIRIVVTLLFEAKRDQYASPTFSDFDFSVFWDTESAHRDHLIYFERSVKTEKELLVINNLYTAKSHTELTFNEISLTEDIADISVYEWIDFTYCNLGSEVQEDTETESGKGFQYTISMRRVEGAWKITDISFYNEATEKLRDCSVDVESFVNSAYHTAQVYEPGILLDSITDGELAEPYVLPDLTVVRLSTTKALSYADQYGGSNRNSIFPDFSNNGGDCQNFASQCLWYGLGGIKNSANISSAKYPMVNSTMSTDTSRQWFVMTDWTHSASWTGVNSFATHVSGGSTTRVGLYGNIYSGVANAQVGDIIQISSNNGASYYHSYVVVEVNGPTAGLIKVSSHTSDRYHETLSLCAPNDTYRTIHVIGVVYITPNSSITPID